MTRKATFIHSKLKLQLLGFKQCEEQHACKADGKRVLVVEKKHRTPSKWFSELFDFSRHAALFSRTVGDAFSWLRFDEIRMVHSMPVDARHNSKIQYGKLERNLKTAVLLEGLRLHSSPKGNCLFQGTFREGDVCNSLRWTARCLAQGSPSCVRCFTPHKI